MGKKSVLSAKPRSFKLHRKSSAASKLKSVISDNLHHYLSDYSDAVLAEYILVLVCNGKDQYQTRDELDAFLAHRSSHFVSWLWDHLLKHDYHTIEHTYSHPTDATLPSSGASHKDSTINNHATAHSHHLPPKDETNNPLPASASESEPSNRELGEGAPQHPGSAAPLSEVYINTELSPALANESFNGVEKPIKIVHNSGNGSPEYPLGKQISASNVVRRSLSPRSISMLSQQHEKSRVSVWDRLGKPCDSTAARGETAEPRNVHVTKLHEQVLNQHMLMHPQLSSEASRSNMLGVPGLGNSCGMNNLSKCRKTEQAVSTIHKSHIQNNIGKKRHSSEISTGPAISSVSLVGENNVDLQHKKNLQELRKSIVTNKDSKPISLPQTLSTDSKCNIIATVKPVQEELRKSIVTNKDSKPISLPPQTLSTDSKCNIIATVKPVQEEVLNVKQRLHQIEIEMSKIRSKQAQKEKDVKFKSSLHSGALKHPEEDIELRTVLVTNVHFAATKETLSLYFAKCGVVVHVMILIDKATPQPKRSAYVTFASKESVDNAVALSGASLLSRTIKVVRKSEAITATTATQFAPTLCQSSLSYQNRKAIHGTPFYSSRHLQWRRDSMSAPSEASPPDSSTNQQLPGSTLSAKTKEANPSTELSEAA